MLPLFEGTPQQPMCGYSNAVVQALNHYGATSWHFAGLPCEIRRLSTRKSACVPTGAHFKSFNVLSDDEVREGVKDYSYASSRTLANRS
jgi:glutaredoxin-related protein